MSSVIYYPGYGQVQVQQNLRVQTILSITQSNPMVLTTVQDHDYVVGMNVSFLIPISFGMEQLNKTAGQVLSLTSDTLTIDIDSTLFDPFVYPDPLPSAYTPPSVIPFSSGKYRPLGPFVDENSPILEPLPYGNETSFQGVIFNGGAVP